MKRIFTFFAVMAVLFMTSMNMNAQTNIPLPNSSFENWSDGNGYSVSVWLFSLPVYSSYTYPTNWSYPTYPVNENFTYSGMNFNVNTDLPLLKVSNESSSVADGSHALKMETFKLSDIISSTVYGLASSSIDEELRDMKIPTILSTGVVDLDNLLPILNTLMVNMSSIAQLMSTFADEDISDYIDGGVALNGLIPNRLTGQYKYTSANGSGDNGGILMLGTKYNTTNHRRELVGGGYTVALTDISTYTNFEILYRPLNDVLPTYPYNDPDTIAIFLFSSANNNRQQGSALFLDNLKLWTAAPVIPEDTCNAVTNLMIDYVDTTLASVSWNYDSNPDHWEAEYGVHGFSHGNGTAVTTSNNSIILSNLLPDTYYDVYVHSVCNDSLASDWSFISFHTDTPIPPVIPELDTCCTILNLTVSNVDTTHAQLSWICNGTPDHWEIEYGEQGFTLGDGISQTTTNTSISLSDLQPDTYYDVHVRSACENDIFGDWAMVSFKTDTLVPSVIPPISGDTTGVNSFASNNILCFPNPAHGSCTLQFNGQLPISIQLYSIDGKLLQSFIPTSETISLPLPYSGIFMLRCETEKGIIIRRIISL